MRVRRWIKGWWLYWRAVYKCRTKRHGAKAQPWPIALSMGRHYRFIAYGQSYPHSRSFQQISRLIRSPS